MVNKKAQAQIITTVLIILLVLAAIIIIWQVISSTIEQGAEEIEGQAGCLGLRIDVTDVKLFTPGITGSPAAGGLPAIPDINQIPGTITIRPTKDISGYQIFIEGVAEGPSDSGTTEVLSLQTEPVEINSAFEVGDEIEIIPTIGDAVCQGYKTKVKL
jgi:hypothetical protein